jgi:hypothetical protein
MADQNLVTLPDITEYIDQRFLLEPLGGPQHPQSHLDRFPEEVYNKTLDSRLVKFLYALLGPAGVGWLRKNYLEARLMVEELGLETFNLDQFYGNPLKFGRIVEEVYDDDPNGLISREGWQRIKARDARYRNRAIDFINGARMGNTPEGMHLVARSGLAHEVEIVENYRALWDEYSDDRLFLPYYGKTRSTEEFVVLPRRELSRSEVQEVRIDGSPTGGTFRLFFPMGNEVGNTTGDIPYNVDRILMQLYLEELDTIGPGNVIVEGGPLPATPIKITFTNQLAARDVPELVPTSNLTGGTIPLAIVDVKRSGIEAADEIVNIAPRDQRYLQEALDRIRPWASIPTVGEAKGLQRRQVWNSAMSSSRFTEVVRYVTGKSDVPWPTRDSGTHWIEANIEHEGHRLHDSGSQHYRGFHNIAVLTPSSTHLGPFAQHQAALYPFQALVPADDFIFEAAFAPATQTEPLTMTNADPDIAETHHQFINGIYPAHYQELPNVAGVSADDRFWASAEQGEGEESLIIDLGSPRAVNYVYFETSRKPFDVTVEYDLASGAEPGQWYPVTLDESRRSITTSSFDFEALNPWLLMEINCTNVKGEMIYTRYVRLRFTRREDTNSPFVSPDGVTKLPWSIEVRNLRVGRNVV